MTDAELQKLSRLQLLEILVAQRREIARLQEQLAMQEEKLTETQRRLERDDLLIRNFIAGQQERA